MSSDRSRAEERPDATRISVCVPVWNGARYAAGLIESLLSQRGARWHLYLGDNASTDDLRGVVDAYPDGRITYQRWERHVGPNENFNRIIASADAPWVLPIGIDDRLDPDALARMSDAVQDAEGAVGMVVAPCRRVGPDGAAVDAQYYGARPPVPTPAGRYDASRWLGLAATGGPFPWTIGSIAFARDLLVESGAFRPEIGLAADMELIFRLAAYADVLVLDTSVVDYLVHLDSEGNTQWAENLQRRDAEVPLARALLAALEAHSRIRRVSARERRLVRRGAAMTYVNRAVQHRLHPGALGRRGAAADLVHAWRLSPSAFASTWTIASGLGSLVAPSAALKWAGAALRRRQS